MNPILLSGRPLPTAIHRSPILAIPLTWPGTSGTSATDHEFPTNAKIVELKTGPAKPPATIVPSLIETAFSTPSDAGRSRRASSGDAGEPAVLGLAPGWLFEADGFGTPEVDVAELPPLGEPDVVQAATSAAIAIIETSRRTCQLVVLTLFDLTAVCRADSIILS